MAGLRVEVQPAVEPILLDDMKNILKVPYADDDSYISGLIVAAREHVEAFTARSLVNKTYLQTLDSFPYYTDTVMSQNAYPPSYYSLPRYSTTLWNYSQMVKLFVSPLVNVVNIAYLSSADEQWHSLLSAPPPWHPNTGYAEGNQVTDGNGNLQQANNAGVSDFNPPDWATVINGTTEDDGSTPITWTNLGPSALNEVANSGDAANTFFTDTVSEPPRIFPGPAGSFWPSVLYVPNAVEIHYVAGYGYGVPVGSPSFLTPPPLIPSRCTTAIQQLVAGWYENREAISAVSSRELPNHLKALLWSVRVLDMQPTRG